MVASCCLVSRCLGLLPILPIFCVKNFKRFKAAWSRDQPSDGTFIIENLKVIVDMWNIRWLISVILFREDQISFELPLRDSPPNAPITSPFPASPQCTLSIPPARSERCRNPSETRKWNFPQPHNSHDCDMTAIASGVLKAPPSRRGIRLVQKINKGVGYTMTLAASDSHGRLRYLTSSKTCPFSMVVQRFLHVQDGDRLTFLSGSFDIPSSLLGNLRMVIEKPIHKFTVPIRWLPIHKTLICISKALPASCTQPETMDFRESKTFDKTCILVDPMVVLRATVQSWNHQVGSWVSRRFNDHAA
ncbi:predicted protein [Histoplasma capsulatum var. duboisii H88]|uniref:Predicted protein n=1 Tax=Ajellomyces capsulatus (strain H88) TaxID=544711 RepID=F0UPG4_AJEC8|nr:predicted protein [Histoplasma capsulatum var. duboisii H88]